MTQIEIQKRQNEDFFLKCQYAARCYFNSGEFYNFLTWVFCIISALCIFLPTSNNVFLVIPFTADILAFIFANLTNKSTATGAKLRNYFDAYVLNLNFSNYSDLQQTEIKEIVIKKINAHKKDCNIQINHTGNQKPPGVRDWYEFSHNYLDEDVQHECQKQNCWWNKKMFRIRMFLYLFIPILLMVFLLCLKKCISNVDFINIFFCSAGIIIRIVERIIVNINYFILSIKIDAVLETTSNCKNFENISHLQNMINARREIPVLELNFIHKHFANILSKLYTDIS